MHQQDADHASNRIDPFTVFKLVVIGSYTPRRGMVTGAVSSTRRRAGVHWAPDRRNAQSINPTMMARSTPKTTTPTLSVTKLSAMTLRPLEKDPPSRLPSHRSAREYEMHPNPASETDLRSSIPKSSLASISPPLHLLLWVLLLAASSAFNNHLDHSFIVLKNIKHGFEVRKFCPCDNVVRTRQLIILSIATFLRSGVGVGVLALTLISRRVSPCRNVDLISRGVSVLERC